jgi:uncharacterized protein (PEP-CTERM system associated)
MRRVSLTFNSSRDVSTFPQTLATLPAGGNVALLLNAALVGRYPDENERARIVDQLISRQGLPSQLTRPTTIFSQQVSIVRDHTLGAAILGTRNTLALTIFRRRLENLPDTILTVSPTPGENSIQTGGSVTLSHQVSPTASLTLTGTRQSSEGIGTETGLRSDDTSLQARLTKRLSARTNVSTGLLQRRFESNVAGSPSEARETAVSVGMNHRF